MRMFRLYLSCVEVVAKVVDIVIGIEELEAKVHGWSSECVLRGFSKTAHVGTLSCEEIDTQVPFY